MINDNEGKVVFFNFEFKSKSTEVTIEETNGGKRALIQGTMLREGVSGNGFLYTIEEMQNIAKQAEGVPIFIGSCTKLDTNYGVIRDGKHANYEDNKVGRIISAVFDPIKRVIKYLAEIVNTKTHPRVIEEVKAGWGVSIGGTADANLVLDKANRLFYKVTGMIFQHLQLLAPHIQLGQNEARVEGIEVQETLEIQESMIFTELSMPYRITSIETDGISGVSITY
jgi:hypothetical protein